MMKLFQIACLGTALVAGSTAHALEVSAHNDIRKLNSGLEQRLETTKAMLTALVNGLKGTIDDILARLTALEGKMTDVTTKQPVAWNTPLENRLANIEGKDAQQDVRITNLENRPAGGNFELGLKYTLSDTIDSNNQGTRNGSWHTANMCFLTYANYSFSTATAGCNIERSGTQWRVQASSNNKKNHARCRMTCVDFELKPKS